MTKQVLHSMTGYGRGMENKNGYALTVEIRGVNGRFLEIRPKLPKGMQYLETLLREKIQEKIHRGVLDVIVGVAQGSDSAAASVDASQIDYYAEQLRLAHKKNPDLSKAELLHIMQLPRVVGGDENNVNLSSAEMQKAFGLALSLAIESFQKARAEEAKRLVVAIVRERELAARGVEKISKQKQQTQATLSQSLRKRLQETLADYQVKIDDSRLLQEVAFYLDRSDITEEIDRLGSHLEQLQLVAEGKKETVAGKRLDLLTQEALREANTIAAKCASLEISQDVMELKLSLERIREQAQNIE